MMVRIVRPGTADDERRNNASMSPVNVIFSGTYFSFATAAYGADKRRPLSHKMPALNRARLP